MALGEAAFFSSVSTPGAHVAAVESARAVASSTCSSTACAPGAEHALEGRAFTKKPLAAWASRLARQSNGRRIALRVDRRLQRHPRVADVDGRFVDSAGLVAGFEVRSAAFFDLWGTAVHPALDRGVVQLQSPFAHQLLQIALALAPSADTSAHTGEGSLTHTDAI
jgi:hypothetical protein